MGETTPLVIANPPKHGFLTYNELSVPCSQIGIDKMFPVMMIFLVSTPGESFALDVNIYLTPFHSTFVEFDS